MLRSVLRFLVSIRMAIVIPYNEVRGDMQMIRVFLTPYLPWGQLCLHVWFRPDIGLPHDHPFDFWIFVFRREGYWEKVLLPRGLLIDNHVTGWTWHRRLAEHSHFVIGPNSGRFPFCSLMWRGRRNRDWGFWISAKEARELLLPLGRMAGHLTWVEQNAYDLALKEKAKGATHSP
jgi:hypothetical protein